MNFYKNGQIYTLQGIKDANPNTSFAVGFDPTEFGYEPILDTLPPDVSDTQYAVQSGVVRREDGKLIQSWEVKDYSTTEVAEIQQRKEADRIEAIKGKIKEIEDGQARAVREAALGNTTYLQQIDAQIQELRNQL